MFGGVPAFFVILHKISQRIPPGFMQYDSEHTFPPASAYCTKNKNIFIYNAHIYLIRYFTQKNKRILFNMTNLK